MNTLQFRMVFVMLIMSLGVTPAWSTPGAPAKPQLEAQAQNPAAAATMNSVKPTGTSKPGLRSIVSDEEIPAFLRTDPCDTKDS